MLQKQVLLDSTYSEDGSSLAELCQPSTVSLDTTDGETPAEACGTWSPLLPHQRAQLLCLQPFTQRRPARWECEGGLSPSPRCQRRPRSRLSVRQEEGMAGEARSRKSSSAASSRALPGAVTKARDCGCGEDGLALPAAAWGLSLCLSGSLHHHEPRRGNLPQLPGTRWAFCGISGMIPLGPLWAARKQELPRITPRRQHAASLILQEKRKTEARKVAVGGGGESLHIRKTVH